MSDKPTTLSTHSIQCVNCKTVLKSPTAVPAGKKVKCPKCQQIFVTGKATAPTPPAPVSRKGETKAPAAPEPPKAAAPLPPAPSDDFGDDEMAAAIAKLQGESTLGGPTKKPEPVVSPAPAPVHAKDSDAATIADEDELAAAIAKLQGEQSPTKKPEPAPAPVVVQVNESDAATISDDDEMAAAIAKLQGEQTPVKAPEPPATAASAPIPDMEIPEVDDDLVVPDEEQDEKKKRDDEEEPRSKKKRRDDDEDEEEPRSKKKRRDDDEDEEEPRSKKKRRDEDDEDEEEPRSKKKRRDEDDDDEEGPPSKKRRRDEDDDDDVDIKKKKKKKKAVGSSGLLIGMIAGGALLLLMCCTGGSIGGYFLFLSGGPDITGKWDIVGGIPGFDGAAKKGVDAKLTFEFDSGGTGKLKLKVAAAGISQEGAVHFEYRVTRGDPYYLELKGTNAEGILNQRFSKDTEWKRVKMRIDGDTMHLTGEGIGGFRDTLTLKRAR